MLLYKVFILTKLTVKRAFQKLLAVCSPNSHAHPSTPNITVMAGGCNLEPLTVFG